jgi:hypothetical protein
LNSISSWISTSLIKTDGTLWTSGNYNSGALGLNDTVSRSSPTQIPGTQWSSVSGFYYIGYGIKTDGTLWAWGYNSSGGLGQNDQVYRSSPTQVPGTQWNSVNGADGAIATKTDGTLWVWGRNGNGQLGLNDTVQRSSPIQVPGTQWSTENWFGSSNNAYLKTDGTLYMSGSNGADGRLGLNDVVSRSSPHQVPGTQWSKPYTWNTTVAIKQA